MANRNFLRSFNGGEVTPEFFGRIDDAKYQTGLAKCRNGIVLPHGPVANRAGTRFVHRAKYANKKARLIRFNYGIIGGVPQSFAIELGEGYFRFHTQASTLLQGNPPAWSNVTAYTIGDMVSRLGVNYYAIAASTNQQPPNATYWYAMPATGEYEIPSPYTEADLFDIHYVQSADVLTLVHPNYAPRELRRYGADDWELSLISFVSELATPSGVAATVGAGSGSTTYRYKVTAVANAGLEESLPSLAASVNNDLLTTNAYNNITWTAVTGAQRYNVYKESNGLYGYIGQTDALTFKDDNITSDISKTPPIVNNPFSGAGNYPDAVSYYGQRRGFAGTDNKPQNFWLTRTGTESNLAYSIPTRDDDSISFRVAAREASRILHMVPLSSLLLMTSSAEWAITTLNTDALTPTSAQVKPQSYIGSSNVQPVIVNNNVIFAAARGGHLRELAYNWQAGGFITGDLSLRAPHLFDNKTIVDMSYAKSPQPIVWTPSSDGLLLGLTYVPENQVGGMHWHDSYTNGGSKDRDDWLRSHFESTVVVEEGEGDYQYLLVSRVIDGQTVRFVERMESRLFATPADAFFVDCGATYTGSPTSTITGLDHLEGEVVNILGDAAVHPQKTVTDGTVTLDAPCSVVHVGLPIEMDVQTLPLVMEIEAFAQGRQKNINKTYLRVSESSGVFAGPSFDVLTEAKQRTDELYGTPPALKSGEIEVMVEGNWNDSGQLCVRQSNPLPLTICSMTLEVAIGG